MSAHLDGEVTPLGVDEVKGVMIDVGPGLLALQMGRTALAGRYLPDQGGCLGDQDQEQTAKLRAGRSRPTRACADRAGNGSGVSGGVNFG